MQDMTYVPEGKYNLFSITKLMKAGWKLQGGMEEGITLIKEGQEVHFGQKVYTTKRMLFVAHIGRCCFKGV